MLLLLQSVQHLLIKYLPIASCYYRGNGAIIYNHVYEYLIINSDCPSAEIKALSLLLEHKEWPAVIDMLNEVYSKVKSGWRHL